MPKIISKDPTGKLDFKFDWAALTNENGDTDWLDTDNSETISSKTVTVPAGITKVSDALADTNTSVLVWLSGGTDGEDYEVACKIVTSDNREDTRRMNIQVRDRY